MMPAKPPYTKPALPLTDQIAMLVAKGMIINDWSKAEHCLQHISYYRLSAYWLPFEHRKEQIGPRFQAGTTLENVLELYEFDRKLRLLVLDALERVEVAVRGGWAHELAMLGGPFGYVDSTHYADPAKFAQNCINLDRETSRSKDTFIRHYKTAYSGPARPPVWMASELLSFGLLSRFYAALKEPRVRQSIAAPFGVDESIFVTVVHQLAIVRNICAHHGRLWNRHLDVGFTLPRKNPPNLAAAMNRAAPKKVYNTLAMLHHLLAAAEPANNWQCRLEAHIQSLPAGREPEMGFLPNWRDLKLWGGTK